MRQFSLDNFTAEVGAVTAAADREPITLLERGEPRYVLMTHDQYRALTAKAGEVRRVFRAENTPDDVADWLLPGLDELATAQDPGRG